MGNKRNQFKWCRTIKAQVVYDYQTRQVEMLFQFKKEAAAFIKSRCLTTHVIVEMRGTYIIPRSKP